MADNKRPQVREEAAVGILEQIEAAGVVGCGGAGFPTHKKLTDNIEYLIVNAAECEPLLWTDRYLMREKAEQIIDTVQRMQKELKIRHCIIAVKRHYEEETAALSAAIARSGADIALHLLESFYPAGDEQAIVYEVTGRVVPPAGIPLAVGTVVQNVATICAIADALQGIPFTHKYLTITGEVNHPVILRVPLGTRYTDCLKLAGGTVHPSFFVITGGPMMGRTMPMAELEQAVVTKTTSGILILPENGYHARTSQANMTHILNRARSACIQCTSCTQLCPRHLLGHPLQPHRIMRKMAVGGPVSAMLHDPDIRSAQLCCECGICESYACPMGLLPRRINRMIKGELAKAGLRWEGGTETQPVSPYREARKVPSEKAAARVQVRKYDHYIVKELLEATPASVEIPLDMHIGPPADPIVKAGDHVKTGDVIARHREGALGAHIHASISGQIQAVGTRIIIGAE